MIARILKPAAVCAALVAAAGAAFASGYPLGLLPGWPEERTASQACFEYCVAKEGCAPGWYPAAAGPHYPFPSSRPDGCTAYCVAVCSPLGSSLPDSGLPDSGLRLRF